MLDTGIIKLSANVAETVAINADRLAQLERLAWLGRFAVLGILAAVVFAIMHVIIKVKADKAIEKAMESTLQDECKSDAYIRGKYQDGIIYTAIKEQIKESCEYGGDIYRLIKSGELPEDKEAYEWDD